MKRIFLLSVLSLLSVMNMNLMAQKLDPTVKPESLPAKEFNFPEYEIVTLKNGMKVFIVKDNQQPTVGFRILINGGSVLDGTKTGLGDITSQMLSKGAGKYTALDIAKKLDGLGVSLSASGAADFNTINGSGLKKHLGTLLELTKEMLTAPTFPQDELEKLKKLNIANIKQQKAKSSSVAAAIGRKALYGNDHPYSQMATEEHVNSITVQDLKDYFAKNFIPNNATMSIIGDVNTKEVKELLEKYLGDWKAGKKPEFNVDFPKPLPQGVYFVKRPGAVQSSINIVTMGVPRNNPDYDKLNLSSSVIGAGFAGRLFKTLRETYSYTYTPFGFVTSSKYVNRFSCGADVRSDVTDSSVSVILEQLNKLATEVPPNEELDLLKKYEVGQYLMSFSNKDYAGMLIQNADFYNLNIKDVKNYHLRMLEYSPIDVMQTAKKYMNPKSAYIVVVGDPKVLPSLEKFGKVFEYNTDYEPITGADAKCEKVNITPQELMNNYLKALGGKDKINSMNTLVSTGKIEMEIQGQKIPGTMTEKYKAPNKKYQSMDLGMMQQYSWCDGKKAWMKVGGGLTEAPAEDLEKMKSDAEFMRYAKMLDLGYKLEVIGKQKDMIVVKAFKGKEEATYYFDAETYLLMKKEYSETMQGDVLPITENYSDYKEFNGVKFPTKVSVETPIYSYSGEFKYEINTPMDDSIFIGK